MNGNEEFNLLGTLSIPNGKCFVSDPVYSTDTWCNWKLEDMIPGTYNCYYRIADTSWGRRVSAIKIVNIEYDKKEIEYEEVPDCHIGVDCGTCGFITKDVEVGKLLTDDEIQSIFNHIDNDGTKSCIIPDLGFFSASGLGDGDYILSVAKDNSNKVYSAFIDYYLE